MSDELKDLFNRVEADIRDLRRVQRKAVMRNLPGVYAMVADRIERLKRARVGAFMGGRDFRAYRTITSAEGRSRARHDMNRADLEAQYGRES